MRERPLARGASRENASGFSGSEAWSFGSTIIRGCAIIFQSKLAAGVLTGGAGFSLALQQLASLPGAQHPAQTCVGPQTPGASNCPPRSPAKTAMRSSARAITKAR